MRTRGVVEAHGGRCVGVGGNVQNGEVRCLQCGLELRKRAQCQGRANHAGEVYQATLERAGEEEGLGLNSKGWWEVLQLFDEWDGMVSVILHVRGDVSIGTNKGTGGQEPVCGMLDIEGARCLLSSCVRWSTGSAMDGVLVQGGHNTDCSAVLYKCWEGCGDSWRGFD
jgi:hypothetical protein